MVLVDKNIKKLIKNNAKIIENFQDDSVTNIGYDLNTFKFYADENKKYTKIDLKPGDSIFVSSNEIFTIPKNICARVVLRNGRIRQGLSLEAPVYQPGHKTRIFFRLTNVSKNVIKLSNTQKYATIILDELKCYPQKPYHGAYTDEFSFSGLGKYQGIYGEQIKIIEEKTQKLEKIEKNIYGNVITIVSVFVTLFTLLQTNITALSQQIGLKSLLIFDFSILGCIGFLVYLIPSEMTKKKRISLIVLSLMFIFLSIVLLFFHIKN